MKVSSPAATNVTDLKKYKSRKNKQDIPKVSTDFSDENGEVSTHFDRKKWKRSRVKKGYLIRRIKGYDISEDEYGVSYLFVVARKPSKKTSADYGVYEHAGFANWKGLIKHGDVVLETKHDRKRLNGNRNQAS